MKKQEIENHKIWQYISSLSGSQRYYALFLRKEPSDIFDVTIEEWPFTRMKEIPEECAYISVTDSSRNISFIAVLKPKSKAL